MSKSLSAEGTVAFWVYPPLPSWSVGHRCNLPAFAAAGVEVSTAKLPDQRLQIICAGPLGRSFEFFAPLPADGPLGFLLALSWSTAQLTLYLAGTAIETKRPNH